MKELTISEIQTIVHRDENRIMEAKKTTGVLIAGMQSGCAFLNTEGGCSRNVFVSAIHKSSVGDQEKRVVGKGRKKHPYSCQTDNRVKIERAY